MRRSSSGYLSGGAAEEGTPAGPRLSPLAKHRRHSSLPINLGALEFQKPPPRPSPLAPIGRNSKPGSRQSLVCHAFPLDSFLENGLDAAQHFVYQEVQLESALHVPAGHAEQCLFDARRAHSASLPRAPPVEWQDAADNTISADWVLSGKHSGTLNDEEERSLAACLAAPPEAAEEEQGKQRAAIQRESAIKRESAFQRESEANESRTALTSSEVTTLSSSQEAPNLEDRFSSLLRRVRRRRRNERIASLQAVLPKSFTAALLCGGADPPRI